MRFFQLHELNIGEGENKLHQLAYLVLILSASFEECSSILFYQSYNGSDKRAYLAYFALWFNKGNNATESARNIKAIYGDRTISVSQCQRWFQKFRAGNYSLKDEPRPGRSVELDEDVLQILAEQNPIVTVEELTEKLGLGHSTIHRHLHAIGKNQQIESMDSSYIKKPHYLLGWSNIMTKLLLLSMMAKLLSIFFLNRIKKIFIL